MSQIKRIQEDQDHYRVVAEDILVEVGYFERCSHYTLVNDDTGEDQKTRAMKMATKFAKENGMKPREMTDIVQSVIDDNGHCGGCEKHEDD